MTVRQRPSCPWTQAHHCKMRNRMRNPWQWTLPRGTPPLNSTPTLGPKPNFFGSGPCYPSDSCSLVPPPGDTDTMSTPPQQPGDHFRVSPPWAVTSGCRPTTVFSSSFLQAVWIPCCAIMDYHGSSRADRRRPTSCLMDCRNLCLNQHFFP